MIKHLSLSNVGPAPKMKLEFGRRLNLLTGDNGLGKSFLLDIVWWSLTRRWPAEINPKLTTGRKVLPAADGEAVIRFSLADKNNEDSYHSQFLRKEQTWHGKKGRPANPGLILYAMSDGSFAVWDPSRNYWLSRDGVDVQERVPAYVFSPAEVWDGLQDENGGWLCNGLLRDWASWQKARGAAFKNLKQVMEVLSPSAGAKFQPGKLTRISLDDVRDIPTIRMTYDQEVPVVNASSGIRRIMALAYFLVWAWEEHKKAAKQLAEPSTNQITFLIDEMESHLHPSWQRNITPALLSVMEALNNRADIQLISGTHSPLVMASVEPFFDESRDAWFDLDLEDESVSLTKRHFMRQGDVRNWLTSEAFDLKSGYSIEAEELLEKAAKALSNEEFSRVDAKALDQRLREVLSDTDPFWMRWRFVAEKKGWLS